MRKIRILVADDSVVVRKMLSVELEKNVDLTVVGAAADGRIALAKLQELNPDIVVMDINMPDMDGLTATSEIHKIYPKTPIIMMSTLTRPNALATLEALTRGASDYVTKPEGADNSEEALATICAELVPKIRFFGRPMTETLTPKAPVFVRKISGAVTCPEIVAIGVSTGGPTALAEVIPYLPEKFPVPIVIVQHMPPVFTTMLAERMGRDSKIKVMEGKAGQVLQPGQVYIAPGGFHMKVEKNGQRVQLSLNSDPPENFCRPAVDVLLRSVAEVYGRRVLAVIMTGMGEDGKKGSQQVVNRGGKVIVQDEASSVVWGMPGAVAKAGLAEAVLPLGKIAGYLVAACAKQT